MVSQHIFDGETLLKIREIKLNQNRFLIKNSHHFYYDSIDNKNFIHRWFKYISFFLFKIFFGFVSDFLSVVKLDFSHTSIGINFDFFD